MKTEKLLILGVIGLGAYFLFKSLNSGKKEAQSVSAEILPNIKTAAEVRNEAAATTEDIIQKAKGIITFYPKTSQSSEYFKISNPTKTRIVESGIINFQSTNEAQNINNLLRAQKGLLAI